MWWWWCKASERPLCIANEQNWRLKPHSHKIYNQILYIGNHAFARDLHHRRQWTFWLILFEVSLYYIMRCIAYVQSFIHPWLYNKLQYNPNIGYYVLLMFLAYMVVYVHVSPYAYCYAYARNFSNTLENNNFQWMRSIMWFCYRSADNIVSIIFEVPHYTHRIVSMNLYMYIHANFA